MKMTDGKAVETWTKSDVASVAKKTGYSLTDKEKTQVLEQMCKGYDREVGCNESYVAGIVKSLKAPANDKPAANSSSSSADSVKWYFHSSSKNETKTAVATALDGNMPMLLYVAKPGCAVCEKVWKEYLKAEKDFAQYLARHSIVGLKIDDTTSHFTELAKAKNSFTGIDGVSGKKVNSTAPFLILFKVSEKARGKTKITLGSNQVDAYLGGFGSAKATGKDYASVTAWLDGILKP